MTTTTAPTGPTSTSRFTWGGVRTVTRLELRQRVRSTRWRVALIVWFALVGIVSLLLASVVGDDAFGSTEGGAWIYGLILLFVLGLGLVVSPTLASTAINGDRNAGTLAILQVTMLGPAEIAVGKLLAGWLSALAFLVTSLPFLLWGAVSARVSVGGFVLSLLVVALLLGVVCAIGIGCSALTTRTAGSSVLTYLAVASLTVISLILFGLTLPAVSSTEQVEVLTVPTDSNDTYVWTTEPREVLHTERTWWLLAINPFVIVADVAPESAIAPSGYEFGGPLGAIREGVRIARDGGAAPIDDCWSGNYPAGTSPADLRSEVDADRTPVWPCGLAFDLALGGLALWWAIRRLAVPYRKLAPGVRVA